MVVPYGGTMYSCRAYIEDSMREQFMKGTPNPFGDDLFKSSMYLARSVWKSISRVVVSAREAMEWLRTVGNAISRKHVPITWTTPSGFIVHQRINKKTVERLTLQLLGECRLHVATEDTDKVDRTRHKAATAPNLIHSLDASLLHLSVQRFDSPIALIHDSVLCRATDMSILSNLVRETYMELFAEQDYLTDFASQIEAETEPPIIGSLKSNEWSVIESTYFFC